jgi:hypothetical protein
MFELTIINIIKNVLYFKYTKINKCFIVHLCIYNMDVKVFSVYT